MPATRTTVDHVQAASVPIEISVSIVAARCRAFRSAARWNPTPAQNTTGVASASATHSQPSNWSGGTIASAASGAVSSAATASRVRTARAGSVPRTLTRQRGVVAGRLDGGDQVVDRHRRGIERHRRLPRSRS